MQSGRLFLNMVGIYKIDEQAIAIADVEERNKAAKYISSYG
jgi:hypothetical protein